MTEDAVVRRLFEDLRDRHFPGRLRGYKTRVGYAPGWSGDGRCDTTRRVIFIAPGVAGKPESLRALLLHEMCHVGTPGHGAAFAAKLDRLIARGETEVESEKGLPDYNVQGSVRAGIYDAVVLDGYSGSFHSLAVSVAREHGMTSATLLRRCPWAGRTFKNARRERAALDTVRAARRPRKRPTGRP